MESWVIGYDGNSDAERHASIEPGPAGPSLPAGRHGLRLRVVSDYI